MSPPIETRRQILVRLAATGTVLAADGVRARSPRDCAQASNEARRPTSGGPFIVARPETFLRLGGYGDDFQMSWAADDRQYVSVCDGPGWLGDPTHSFNSRLWAMEGGALNATFHFLPGYPNLIDRGDRDFSAARYYCMGTLAVDGSIYQYLSLLKFTGDPIRGRQDKVYYWSHVRWCGAKLIYSPDNGQSWHNQDGSTPVVWETPSQQSKRNMIFFDEPQDAFAIQVILQMGRNYEHNKDGYVYGYAQHSQTDPGGIALFRVRRSDLFERRAYEFFGGLRSGGKPRWVADILSRVSITPVEDPGGTPGSVVYNAPLNLYIMATTRSNEDLGPSQLGFSVASTPWGPWRQIYSQTGWAPGTDSKVGAYMPQIAPKWIAADGRSFWLVSSAFGKDDAALYDAKLRALEPDLAALPEQERYFASLRIFKQYMPYYSFNVQKFDICDRGMS